ncbi:MAG: hypothetical protein QOE34_2373 [Verrucomicrobiota bacterium]|jgi:hypothetical protein
MSGENDHIADPGEAEGDAPRKDRHDFLAALLKDARSALIDFMFKQAAVLTLVLGWILSSKETHEFLQSHQSMGLVAIPAVCCYFALLIFWIWNYRLRSDSAYHHLLNLSYMPKEYYSALHVTNAMAVSLVGAHFILCAVLTTALLQLG